MWKPHVYRVGSSAEELDTPPSDPSILRTKIEPWLSAVFQSEHLSLLLGSGFTTAISASAGAFATNMGIAKFDSPFEPQINDHAEKSAAASGRGKSNIEDQIRAALALRGGLEVLADKRLKGLDTALDKVLSAFLKSLLETEKSIRDALEDDTDKAAESRSLLVSFLLSFASRAASRERLQVFTTNYDRLIEYGCDLVGLRCIDRFVGALSPVFRSSRVEVDMHYNPPGIRGEPRYLEGVIKLTKLHGSIDWRFEKKTLRRYGVSFGATTDHPDVPESPLQSVMIYPNPAKDVETIQYPYAELFRDFSSALCKPNSVLVTYGYGFGDDHVNRVIRDMLTIPSTHLVVISFDDAAGRIPAFCETVGHKPQMSLLIGHHFGDLGTLVEHYLPKPAIDQISWREADLRRRRGGTPADPAGTVPSTTPSPTSGRIA